MRTVRGFVVRSQQGGRVGREYVMRSGRISPVSRRNYLRFRNRIAFLHVSDELGSWARMHGIAENQCQPLVWPLVVALNGDVATDELVHALRSGWTSLDSAADADLTGLAGRLLARPYLARVAP